MLSQTCLNSIFSSCTVGEEWFICKTRLQKAWQTCSKGLKSRKYARHCIYLISSFSRVFDASAILCKRALSSIDSNSGFFSPLKRRTWYKIIICLQHRFNETLMSKYFASSSSQLCIRRRHFMIPISQTFISRVNQLIMLSVRWLVGIN